MKLDLIKLAKKYKLSLIVLFGSMADGKIHAESDADLAYLRDKELSLKDELNLRASLMKIFQKEIDLVFIPKASPLLLREIAVKGRLVYGNKRVFNEMKINSIKKFIDFEPYFRLREKLLNHHFA